MKKVLKLDKIPFHEMVVSRKTSFDELLKQISVTFSE
jgi:hypothetical protein